MIIQEFIFCDDVRQEMWNKQTVVGIWGENLLFQIPDKNKMKWPLAARLGLFIRLKKEQEEINPDSFSISVLFNDKECFNSKGNILVNNNPTTLITITMVNNNFSFPGEGIYKFKITLYSKNNIIFDNFPVNSLNVSVAELKNILAS